MFSFLIENFFYYTDCNHLQAECMVVISTACLFKAAIALLPRSDGSD